MKRLLVSLVMMVGVAFPTVAAVTSQPASAALPICLKCLLNGGNILSGSI
jgi:hypothetical protein